MQIGSWHLQQPASFLLYIFIPSLLFGAFFLLHKGSFFDGRASADMASCYAHIPHICVQVLQVVSYYMCTEMEGGIRKYNISEGRHFATTEVPIYDVIKTMFLQVES